MLYQLKRGPVEETILKQAVYSNIPLPDWLRNAPVLREDLTFYMIAFNDLSTCRAIGMAEGPIPWTAMKEYSNQYDLDDDEFDALVYVVQSMDSEYLTYRSKQR